MTAKIYQLVRFDPQEAMRLGITALERTDDDALAAVALLLHAMASVIVAHTFGDKLPPDEEMCRGTDAQLATAIRTMRAEQVRLLAKAHASGPV